MTMEISARRRKDIVDALRRGVVPVNGLDALAVGLGRFEAALDDDLDRVAGGGSVFKAVRGEYGAGKTFFTRWLAERAKRRGFAAAEVQISELETPLHRMETVYRRLAENLSTEQFPPSALRPILDGWLYALEEDVLAGDTVAEDDTAALDSAVGKLLETRLAEISRSTPGFAAALRGYRAATATGDHATADGVAAWLGGQPHVAAAARRAAGVKGDLDHFAAMSFLQGLLTVLRDSGHPGLLLVLDEVETLQRVRTDARDKALNALRQLIDEIYAGRFPGLLLIITGTPAFYEHPGRAAARTPRPAARHRLRLRPSLGQSARHSAAPARLLPGCPGRVGCPGPRHLRQPGGRRPDRSPVPAGARRRRHRQARRPGRGRTPRLPQETGGGRAGPGRPVRRLEPARALRADRALRRVDRGGTQCRFRRRHPPAAVEIAVSVALDPVLLHHIVNTLGWPDLRPLQHAAVAPLAAGEDALLLAPTAGGKTEAATSPILTRMAAERWTGTSVLYLCPLKALINNLEPRLERYAGWIGRRAALWHGDVTTGRRRAILANRPDILLTTPESLESMLVSAKVDHRAFFSGLQAVIVDEVHAFAGDDRGWHLLAVLERLTHLIGRPLQRVGLSATVGNPDQLLTWLQGAAAGSRPATVVAPDVAGVTAVATPRQPPGEIELDYVGTLPNAAKVIASLHAGEKRLVFCEARQTVEHLGQLLRGHGITTFLSHASLSTDERRRSEAAFAEARDCVIVSTSTLELGIDVGDLDRVIQIDSPATVASFLQRLGRTGRRSDTVRNCLFLTVWGEALIEAAALLLLWGRGWVEPVTPTPEPRHIVAQQVMALCLQEHQIGDRLWPQWWNGLAPFDRSAEPIVRHLAREGYLDNDGGMYFIGPEAEKRFGRRHFMDITAVFLGAPEFTVFVGRDELGKIDPCLLTEEVPGPRRLLLAGRSWQVTYIDWKRRRCFVEPVDSGGKSPLDHRRRHRRHQLRTDPGHA